VVLSRNCFLCKSPNHFKKECPHRDAVANLISRRNSGSDGRGRRGRGHGNGYGGNGHTNVASTSNNTNGNSTSTTTTANDNTNTGKSASQESAGVASAFLSCDLHLTDIWLCDSGASSSMSNACSAFLSLKPDRCPICLADGKVIYSSGLGSINFLSDCGYHITIHDVLFVPSVATRRCPEP